MTPEGSLVLAVMATVVSLMLLRVGQGECLAFAFAGGVRVVGIWPP